MKLYYAMLIAYPEHSFLQKKGKLKRVSTIFWFYHKLILFLKLNYNKLTIPNNKVSICSKTSAHSIENSSISQCTSSGEKS